MLQSLLCWVDIEYSFAHRTSTVLQPHRIHPEAQTTQECPEPSPVGSAVPGRLWPPSSEQSGPGAVRGTPGPAGPSRADPHTARGSEPRPRLPMERLRQRQRRGTAKTQGALKGCRRPPHLASLRASGVTNARRDRRSYRRGSRTCGDSRYPCVTQMAAGLVLLSGSPRLAAAVPGSTAALRWQTRTALAAPHLRHRCSSASWRLPGSPASPAPAATTPGDAEPPPSIAGRERGSGAFPAPGRGDPSGSRGRSALPRPPCGAARPPPPARVRGARAAPLTCAAGPGQQRALPRGRPCGHPGIAGACVAVTAIPSTATDLFTKQTKGGCPSKTTATCCSRHLIITSVVLVFW